MDNWIRPSDYAHLIQEDHLDQILNDLTDKEYVLNEAEQASEVELTSYLRGYYDTGTIFEPIPDWDEDTVYQEGDNVWYNEKVYQYEPDGNPSTSGGGSTGPAGTSGATPENDDDWILFDSRNAKIKQCYMDICLYHIHSRISPRNIPHLRIVRYEQCLDWLDKISKGDLTIDLPENEDENGNTKRRKPRVNSVWNRAQWFWSAPAPHSKTYE